MRLDLLQVIRKLLGILSAAAAVAETVQGVIGDPGKGQRAGDGHVSQLVNSVGLGELVGHHGPGGPAPAAPPPGAPPNPPTAPIGTGVQVPAGQPQPGPGEVITR